MKNQKMAAKRLSVDIKNLLAEAENKLSNSDAPEVDAGEIINFVFGFSRTDILISPKREVEKEKLDLFNELVDKRSGGYPLQYILGEWDFFGNTFSVREGVLIPRCETEQLADECCKFLKGKNQLVVFDLCSGTGCIGLSVAANNPSCRVYLTDISGDAIDCQGENLKRLSLDNVTIMDYDIFSGFDKNRLPLPDVILCNPPYVTEEEFGKVQKELYFEPKSAIVAPENGLAFYRCLCSKWLPFLNKKGMFMFESGEEQPLKIIDIIKNTPALKDLQISAQCIDDMYGVCRFVKGTVN